MSTLAERAGIAEDVEFIRRVRTAMVTAAVAVQAESDATPDHDKRAELAAAVLEFPNEWAKNFAIGVATNPNTGTGTSDPAEDDGACEFVVNSMWDAFTK